jgi:hypothetical protein
MRMRFKTCTEGSVHIFPLMGDRMRILVVGPQFPDSFAQNIAVTLGHMGHDVIESIVAKLFRMSYQCAS